MIHDDDDNDDDGALIIAEAQHDAFGTGRDQICPATRSGSRWSGSASCWIERRGAPAIPPRRSHGPRCLPVITTHYHVKAT